MHCYYYEKKDGGERGRHVIKFMQIFLIFTWGSSFWFVKLHNFVSLRTETILICCVRFNALPTCLWWPSGTAVMMLKVKKDN